MEGAEVEPVSGLCGCILVFWFIYCFSTHQLRRLCALGTGVVVTSDLSMLSTWLFFFRSELKTQIRKMNSLLVLILMRGRVGWCIVESDIAV